MSDYIPPRSPSPLGDCSSPSPSYSSLSNYSPRGSPSRRDSFSSTSSSSTDSCSPPPSKISRTSSSSDYDESVDLDKDSSPLTGDESNFWSSSPRSDSPSPNSTMPNTLVGSYSYFAPASRAAPSDQRHPHYRNTYVPPVADNTSQHVQVPFVRVVKRRTTANKKERRRTQSINNAYADLRDCIPNVPPDTKLSKIKTLRLATSYINYLVKALESDDPAGGFTAELGSISRKSTNNPVQVNDCSTGQVSPKSDVSEDMNKARKAKGRTGWPQHVWALELEQDQAL